MTDVLSLRNQACAESERSVLGSLLLGGHDTLEQVAPLLDPSHFHDVRHRGLYGLMLEQAAAGNPIDAVSLNPLWVELAGKAWERLRATEFLAGLNDSVPSPGNAVYYASRVRRLYALRAMLRELDECQKIVAASVKPGDEVTVLRNVEQRVSLVARSVDVELKARPIADFAPAVLEEYQRAEQGLAGLSTGLVELDAKTGGLRGPGLYVLGALTGHGKTSLALTILRNVARSTRCLLYSREIDARQVAEQVAISEGRLPGHLVRSGSLDRGQKRTLLMVLEEVLPEINLWVDAATDDVALMAAHARRMHRDGGLGLVVVDYAQLTEAADARGADRRDLVIGKVSRTLKLLALDTGIPVLLLSQFNREGAKRDGGPTLNDLKESGSLAQDADQVWILHRPEASMDPERVPAELKDRAVLNVAKNRHGPMGPVSLRWVGWHQTFTDWT